MGMLQTGQRAVIKFFTFTAEVDCWAICGDILPWYTTTVGCLT